MKGIFVKAFFNTHPDGSDVNFETVEWDSVKAPVCIYGPFEGMAEAIDFMENGYPDGDTDLHDMVADEFDIPDDWYVNDPAEFLKQFEDEDDTRDEDLRDGLS